MDLDIDTPSWFQPQTIFKNAVQASMVNRKNELVKHPCGVYLQNMAVDSITGLAAIPHEESEILGYFKVDFLHLNLLDSFGSKKEIRKLLRKEPNWDLLLEEDVVSTLFQIGKHHSILCQVKPRSIQELADVIAIIRPNKRYLLGEYLLNKNEVRSKLYRQEIDDKSAFRRGHAIAYSLTIVLQLHIIEQSRS